MIEYFRDSRASRCSSFRRPQPQAATVMGLRHTRRTRISRRWTPWQKVRRDRSHPPLATALEGILEDEEGGPT